MEDRDVYFKIYEDHRLIKSDNETVRSTSWTDAQSQIVKKYQEYYNSENLVFEFPS
ncbi:hypothetical protein GCM10027423_62580 [Spirosoma arcticum]